MTSQQKTNKKKNTNNSSSDNLRSNEVHSEEQQSFIDSTLAKIKEQSEELAKAIDNLNSFAKISTADKGMIGLQTLHHIIEDLKETEKELIKTLVAHKDENGNKAVSQAQIAEKLNVNPNTITRWLKTK